MTAPRDADRLTRAYLEGGPTRLPDRSYDEVRAQIDRTRQRVVIGPWRQPRVTALARLALVAVAVLAVTVTGMVVMPRWSALLAPASTPSPAPSPSVTPTPAPAATALPQASSIPPLTADRLQEIPAPLHGTWEATVITGSEGPRVPNGSYSVDFRSDVLLTGPLGTKLRDFGGVTEVTARDAHAFTYSTRIDGPCGTGRYDVERRPEDHIRFTLVDDTCAERAAILTSVSWEFGTAGDARMGPFTAGKTYESGTFTEPFRFVMPAVDATGENAGLPEQFLYAWRYVSDGGLRFGGAWWSMRILDDVPLNVDVCDETSALLADIPSTPQAVGEWLRSSAGVTVSEPVEVPVDGRTALRFDIGESATPCPGSRLPAGGYYGYRSRAYAIPTGDDTILLVGGSDEVNYEAVKAAMEAFVRSMQFE